MTINEALSYRKERLEDVAKCYKNESLATCMERIIKAEVHRLVVVDQDEHVIGVLSLSDLLNYLVIRPTKIVPHHHHHHHLHHLFQQQIYLYQQLMCHMLMYQFKKKKKKKKKTKTRNKITKRKSN